MSALEIKASVRASELEARNKLLQEKLEKAREDALNAENELSLHRKESESLRKKLASVETPAQNSEQDTSQMASQVSRRINSVEEVRKQRGLFAEAAEEMVQSYKDKLASLSAKYSALEDNLHRVERERDASTAEISQLRQNDLKLKRELSETSGRFEVERSQRQELQAKVMSMENNANLLADELARSQREIEEERKLREIRETDLTIARSEFNDILEKLHSSGIENRDLFEKVDSLNNQLKERTEEFAAIKARDDETLERMGLLLSEEQAAVLALQHALQSSKTTVRDAGPVESQSNGSDTVYSPHQSSPPPRGRDWEAEGKVLMAKLESMHLDIAAINEAHSAQMSQREEEWQMELAKVRNSHDNALNEMCVQTQCDFDEKIKSEMYIWKKKLDVEIARAAENEIKIISPLNSQAIANRTELESQLRESNVKCSSLERDLSEAKATILESDSKLKDSRKAEIESNARLKEAGALLLATEEKSDTLAKEIDNLKKSAATHRKDLKRMIEDRKSALLRIAELEGDQILSQKKIKEFGEKLKSSNERMKSLESSEQNVVQNHAQLLAKFRGLQKSFSQFFDAACILETQYERSSSHVRDVLGRQEMVLDLLSFTAHETSEKLSGVAAGIISSIQSDSVDFESAVSRALMRESSKHIAASADIQCRLSITLEELRNKSDQAERMNIVNMELVKLHEGERGSTEAAKADAALRLAEASMEVLQWKAHSESLQCELEKSESRLNESQAKHDERVEQLNDELERCGGVISAHESCISDLEQKVESLEGAIQSSEHKFSKLDRLYNEVRMQLRGKDATLKAAEAEAERLREKVLESGHDIKEIMELRSRAEDDKNSALALVAKVDVLEEQLKKQVARCELYQLEVKRANADVLSMEQTIASLQTERNALPSKVKDVEIVDPEFLNDVTSTGMESAVTKIDYSNTKRSEEEINRLSNEVRSQTARADDLDILCAKLNDEVKNAAHLAREEHKEKMRILQDAAMRDGQIIAELTEALEEGNSNVKLLSEALKSVQTGTFAQDGASREEIFAAAAMAAVERLQTELDSSKARSARESIQKNRLIADLDLQLTSVRHTLKMFYSSAGNSEQRGEQHAHGGGSKRSRNEGKGQDSIISDARRAVSRSCNMSSVVNHILKFGSSTSTADGSAKLNAVKGSKLLQERVDSLEKDLEKHRKLAIKAKARSVEISAKSKFEREKLSSDFQSKIDLLEAELKKKELLLDETRQRSRAQISDIESAFQSRVLALEQEVDEQRKVNATDMFEAKKANSQLMAKFEAVDSDFARYVTVGEANEQDWTTKVRMRDLEIDFLRKEIAILRDTKQTNEETMYNTDDFEKGDCFEEETVAEPVQPGLYSANEGNFEGAKEGGRSLARISSTPTGRVYNSIVGSLSGQVDDDYEDYHRRVLSRRLVARPDLSTALLEHSRAKRSASRSTHNRDYSHLIKGPPSGPPHPNERPLTPRRSGLQPENDHAQSAAHRGMPSPRIASSRKDRWQSLLASSTSLVSQDHREELR